MEIFKSCFFTFCSELRNGKSDPVINLFHGGGQHREFCKMFHENKTEVRLHSFVLDTWITSMIKGVDFDGRITLKASLFVVKV